MAKRQPSDLPPSETAPETVIRPSENFGIWFRPDRPRVVGVIGWICAAVGYAGFVLKAPQLLIYFWPAVLKAVNPAWTPMPLSRGQFAISVLILLAELGLALYLIAAGLGALKLREWGRLALIRYAFIAAGLTILKAAWQIYSFDAMLDFQASTTTQPFDRQAMGNAQFFAMLMMTAAQLLWCAIVASLMSRIYVKAAFDRAENAIAGLGGGWRSS